jgi:hypothetical protein
MPGPCDTEPNGSFFIGLADCERDRPVFTLQKGSKKKNLKNLRQNA